MKISKFYVYSVFTIVSIIMLIMNFSVLIFNPVLFLIETFISMAIIIFLFLLVKRYIEYITNTSECINSLIGKKNIEVIESVPMPLAITKSDMQGDILSCNDAFKEIFLCGEEYYYSSIWEFLPTYHVDDYLSLNGVSISFRERNFIVYCKQIEQFYIFYFLDNTEQKKLKKKYLESRTCIGIAAFDNKDELYQNIGEEQGLSLLVAVESELSNWMKESNGIMKKLSDGKYLLIFEEKYLNYFIEKKFDIINRIHNIKVDEHKFATLSCGIGKDTKNLEEAKSAAENALNMALGRGGDQVAIKYENSYEFFGGNSKGLEKHSRVRTRVVATALLEKIQSCDSVFIMGHKFSDFDSVGASVGLWSICSSVCKKPSYIVLNRETSMARPLLNLIDKFGNANSILSPDDAMSKVTDNSFLIVVDTHSEKFLENYNLYHIFSHTAVIDHHRMTVDKLQNIDIFFHEPSVSSTCEMVTELIQYMGDNRLKKWQAECLLAGITLDTKSFSKNLGVRTFEAGAYLRRKGADSLEIKKMFANSMENYKTKCKIVESAYIINSCAIAKYSEESENIRICCSQAADELLDIKDIKASFVIFKNGEGVDISARSSGKINVQVIMESFGGGGHQTMAAVHIRDMTLEDVETKLVELIKLKSLE